MHNETVKNFLKKNEINPIKISRTLNTQIKSMKEINPLFERYGIFKAKQIKRVSIADIVGYDYEWMRVFPDIFKSLDSFFDINGDSYHSRSCEDLEKTPEEMLTSDSFKREPIILNNLEPELGLYIVSSNGLHRYSALRALYLAELYKSPQNKKEIKEKYTIEAVVSDIDRIKTYCSFIISNTMKNASIRREYDDYYNPTSNVILKVNNEESILNDFELLNFTKNLVLNNAEFIDCYLDIKGFKEFVENSFYNKINMEATCGRK